MQNSDPSSFPFTPQELAAAVDRVRSLTTELHQARAARSTETAKLVGKKTSLAVLELKRLNRLSVNHIKGIREQTEKKKQHVDRQHLKLQNLLYEKEHLLMEIRKCRDFASAHESMELITVAEIEALKPGLVQAVLAKSTHDKDNAPSAEPPAPATSLNPEDHTTHELTLFRLEQELAQRKELEARIKAQKTKRDLVEGSLNNRRSILEKIPAQIEAFLKGAEPLKNDLSQAYDGLLPAVLSGTPLPAPSAFTAGDLSRLQDQLQAPQVLYYHQHLLLPRPLYILFTQLCGYRDAYKDQAVSLTVSIDGNLMDARAMPRGSSATHELVEFLKKSGVASAADGKQDAPAPMDTSSTAAISTASSSSFSAVSATSLPPASAGKLDAATLPPFFSSASPDSPPLTAVLFRRHPLHVSVKLAIGLNNIIIDFFYLVYLNLVTCRWAFVDAGSRKEAKPYFNELFSSLFDSDQGRASPNAAVQHLLDRYHVTASFQQLLDPSEYVYRWTQWICGMDFPSLLAAPSSNKRIWPSETGERLAVDSTSLLGYQPDLLGDPIAANEVSARRHLPAVFIALQHRVTARAQLGYQLTNLDMGKVVDTHFVAFPALQEGSLPKLKSWTPAAESEASAVRPRLSHPPRHGARGGNEDLDGAKSSSAADADSDVAPMSLDGDAGERDDEQDAATSRPSSPLPDSAEQVDSLGEDNFLCFKCLVQGPEAMNAFVAIPRGYPAQPSVLRIGFAGSVLTPSQDTDSLFGQVLQLEELVNSTLPQSLASFPVADRARLLSVQVKCLQAAMVSYIASHGKSLSVEYSLKPSTLL